MRKIISALLALITISALSIFLILFWKNPPAASGEKVIVIVKGSSISAIADSLAEYGLIRSKFTFKIASRLMGVSTGLQPGSYRIASGLNNSEILSRFTGTEFALIFEITIPEGSTIRKIASIAKDKLRLDSALIIKLAHDNEFLRSVGIPKEAKSAEGFLFPDTYRFYLMMTPQELIRRMVSRFQEVVTDSLLATNTTKLSQYELLTFASIVEAEAQRPDERDTIAGVYLNRLNIGMKLDADPTVQYGLGLNRPITHNDLLRDNPYNTYFNIGLPPGPINNPGKAAIIAALHPAHHNKLFFVAKRDGTGGHYFSKTMAEQEKMIRVSNRNEGK